MINGAILLAAAEGLPTVYRGADNPSDVTVVGSFDSLDEALSFLNGAEVREAMKASGVETPQIWFADEAN